MDAAIEPKVVQSLNASTGASLQPVAKYVLSRLLGEGSSDGSPTDNVALVDSVSFIYALALKQKRSAASLQEFLSNSSGLRGEVVKVLIQSYDAAVTGSQILADDDLLLRDGFLPRLHGVSWRLGHVLGDRTQDPPSKSLPGFEFELLTTTGAHPQGGIDEKIRMNIPAERLVDLQKVLKEMIKEAELCSTGGGPK